MVKRVLFALLFVATIFGASAQVSFVSGSPDKLYDMADDQDKLVFMDLYASWCPPCKMMERDVFSRSDVGTFMSKNFISAKFNVDEKMGGELSRKYGVSSIPTYLIFSDDGELIGRMSGATQPTEFIAQMQKVIDAEKKKR